MPDINKAYTWAVNTCNAPKVGYSQTYRNQRTVNGITYYDCSSFINYALLAGGFVTPNYAPNHNSFTTYVMGAELLRLGFKKVNVNGEWKAGDIALNPPSHVEMVYKGGMASGVCMGAHTNNAPLSGQVSIGSSSGNPDYISTPARFPELYRYGDGASGEYGYSIFVISAICGNAWQESQINSGYTGSPFGMFQWLGDRRTNAINWLNTNHYALTDPIGQLEFLVHENDWQGTYGGISNLDQFLNSKSTDISMLTLAFFNCWERASDTTGTARVSYAMKCYDYILNHAQDTKITDWVIKAGYLTEAETLNNAVMLYRYYSTGGGGGTLKKKGMPLWMKIRYY